MTDVLVQPSVTAELVAHLKRVGKVPDITVFAPPPGPLSPLVHDDLIEAARPIFPIIATYDPGERIAELTTRRPWIEDVAWVEFEYARHYAVTDPPAALLGDTAWAYYDVLLEEFGGLRGILDNVRPKAVITLADPPGGNGCLVTCRVHAAATGPRYPGFFYLNGPGGAVNIQSNGGGATILSYLVPAGTKSPVKIEIHTNWREISEWVFHDCVVTQL